MVRIKRFTVGLLAVLIIAAVAAATAQAAGTEGPWIDVSGKRLGPNETRAATASAEAPLILLNKTAGSKIECESVKGTTNGAVGGSTGKNSSTGFGVGEFSNCRGGGKSESLTTCEPEGGTITTASSTGIVGYSEADRQGEILVLSLPRTGNFATIKFTGTACITGATAVTGSIVALWLRAGVPVRVGEEFLSSKLLFTVVAASTKTTFFYETNGKIESLKSGLTAFGTVATAEGTVEGELAGGALVGILTGCSACTGFGA